MKKLFWCLLCFLLLVGSLHAATFTPEKGYPQPVPGGDIGQWGAELNQGFSILDNNVGGTAAVSVAGGVNVTATQPQYQCLIQNLTGALTASIQYILPQLGSFYAIENNTTGNFTIAVVTSAMGSTGVVVPQGTVLWVYSDGTNVYPGAPTGWQEIGNYSLAGQASVAFPLPVAFRRFRLTMHQVQTSLNAGQDVRMQLSGNGGSTYQATGYQFVEIYGYSVAGTAPAIGRSTSTTNWPIFSEDYGGGDGVFEISPGSATYNPFYSGRYFLNAGSTNGFILNTISGLLTASPLAVQNFGKIFTQAGAAPSAGTFSAGTLIVEGLP